MTQQGGPWPHGAFTGAKNQSFLSDAFRILRCTHIVLSTPRHDRVVSANVFCRRQPLLGIATDLVAGRVGLVRLRQSANLNTKSFLPCFSTTADKLLS